MVNKQNSTSPVIAYQGEPGAYSEAALLQYFGNSVIPVGKNSFEDVFQEVEKQKCNFGFIPIENSLEGSIHRNYDLLQEYKLFIIGETILKIQHCLITRPEVEKEEIRIVKSHPQALGQCRKYLSNLPNIKIEPVYDTAGAVKQLSESTDRSTAAIASSRAAMLYEMKILEEGIEDNQANFTRFLILGTQPVEHGNKISIVVSLRNQPGSLFKALSVFALRDINLTKLESRPLIGKPGEYLFYIDFMGSLNDTNTKNALNHLEEYSVMQRVLGCYLNQTFQTNQ